MTDVPLRPGRRASERDLDSGARSRDVGSQRTRGRGVVMRGQVAAAAVGLGCAVLALVVARLVAEVASQALVGRQGHV